MTRRSVLGVVASWSAVAGLLAACGSEHSAPEDVGMAEQATSFCPANWTELGVNPEQPFNAVGYLDNGCSAELIGPNHILAAGHCFSVQGDWSPVSNGTMQFYPNFDPSRVPAWGAANVPRMDVTRVVVGQQTWLPQAGNDWGIAYVANPQSTSGLDLTPAKLWATNAANLALYNVGYPRAYFTSGTWSTVHPDVHWHDADQVCGPFWVVAAANPPAGEGVGCNTRWQYGQIDRPQPPAICTVLNWNDGATGALTHNCDTTGGSSGAPLFAANPMGNQRQVVGVTWGGSNNNFDANPPDACQVGTSNPNFGVATTRIINVPRFATNVALARRTDGSAGTAVFAADSDTDEVKYRARAGAAPGYSAAFGLWATTGGVGPAGSSSPIAVAACDQTPTNRKPRVFAISQGIATSTLYSSTPWTAGWSDFTMIGSGTATDVDTAEELYTGRCQVSVVRGGALHTRWMTSESASGWSNWATVIPANGYKRVTTQRIGGRFWVVVLDANGKAWHTYYPATGGWSALTGIGFPSGVTAWTDVDFGYDGFNNAVFYAYSNAGGNAAKLFQRTVSSAGAWTGWSSFSTTRYCVGCDTPPAAPTLTTLTASHWMEHAPGTSTPAVFGTDTFGNVYHLSNGLAAVGTQWHSFYSDYIPVP